RTSRLKRSVTPQAAASRKKNGPNIYLTNRTNKSARTNKASPRTAEAGGWVIVNTNTGGGRPVLVQDPGHPRHQPGGESPRLPAAGRPAGRDIITSASADRRCGGGTRPHRHPDHRPAERPHQPRVGRWRTGRAAGRDIIVSGGARRLLLAGREAAASLA